MKIPIFAYPGSKGRLSEYLCTLMPQNNKRLRFVDVFAGRGNVAWAAMTLLPFRRYWLNDINPRIVSFFRCLPYAQHVTVPDRWISVPKKHFVLHKKLLLAREAGTLPVGIPSTILLEPYLSFNGAGYKEGGRKTSGRHISPSAYKQNLLTAQALMESHDVKVTSLPFEEILDSLGPDNFVFCDPPYIGADASAYSDVTIDHRKLVTILRRAKFRWMLCEYDNPIYKPLGIPTKIQTKVMMDNPSHRRGGKRKNATECVWTNY
jgi:DNA adenine methylase